MTETLPLVSTITAEELFKLDLQPTPMIVPGLVSVGLNILAANPKVGKSFMALQLAHAVSTGGYFLGQSCKRGRVIYMALEDTLYRLRDRMQQLGLRPNDMLELATSSETLKRGGLEALHNTIHRKGDISLIILDTLTRVRDSQQGTANVYDSDSQLGAALQSVAFDGHCAIMLIHHLSKAGNKDFLLSLSGSAGLPGTADVVMGLEKRRKEVEAKLHITGRDLPERSVDLVWGDRGWHTLAEDYQAMNAMRYAD